MTTEARFTAGIEALLEERLNQLASLSALSSAVARAAGPGEACTAALDCLAETLSPDRAAILLLDERGVMRFRAWRGLSERYRAETEGHSPWPRGTAEPAPVLVPDVASAPSLARFRGVLEEEGIRGLGFFPLMDRGRLLGKFMVYHDVPHVFTPIEVRLAQAIGAHVALEIARSEREARTSFLVEASRVLAHSLDPDVTLRRLAELSVPSLADRCEVHLAEPEGLERVALAQADARAAGVEPDPVAKTAAEVVATGRPRWLEEEGPHRVSAMILPLRARGRVLGAMSFVGGDGRRRYDRDDRAFARELARRAALAIDNALLHEAEQRARDVAERFQTVTEELAQVLTKTEVAEVVVRDGAAAVGAAAGWVAEIDGEPGGRLRTLATLGYDDHHAAAVEGLPLAASHPAAVAARENRALWFASAGEACESYPSLAEEPWAASFEAMMVVPLASSGRSIGVLALHFARGRTLREDERRLLLGLAAQSGQALERARLYAELQKRADAASVLAHVGDGVFRLDREERVTTWNRSAALITGIEEGDALGRPIAELVANWNELRPLISITETPLPVGRRRALTMRVDDRELALAISGVATADGIVYAFRDVTESEQLERARRDFLTTASHELRTPLAGVFGATKTLLHRELDDATRRTMLEVIDSQSQRLAEILDELLHAARLDAGKLELEIRDHDLAPILDDVVALQRVRAPEGTTVVLRSASRVPRVRCDADKLRQVLVNLIDNAVKYSPDGGTITVSTRAEAERVRITVADEGLGIPAGAQEHVFEKFFRLDPHLVRGVRGTGLGLYICREFVTGMNGRIWVDPASRVGTTIHVELPRA